MLLKYSLLTSLKAYTNGVFDYGSHICFFSKTNQRLLKSSILKACLLLAKTSLCQQQAKEAALGGFCMRSFAAHRHLKSSILTALDYYPSSNKNEVFVRRSISDDIGIF